MPISGSVPASSRSASASRHARIDARRTPPSGPARRRPPRPRPRGCRRPGRAPAIRSASARDSASIRAAAAASAARQPSVRALLRDQLLLLRRQGDPRLQLVLADRALPLDRQRAALVRRPVGLLLDQLAGRGLQRPLDVRLGPDGHHPDADHADPGVVQPLVGDEALRRPAPGPQAIPTVIASASGQGGEQIERVLLGELGQQRLRPGRAGRPASCRRRDRSRSRAGWRRARDR